MEKKRHNLSPNLEDLRRLVHEKAGCLLKDFTADNLDYFTQESAILARKVMEKYVFAVYSILSFIGSMFLMMIYIYRMYKKKKK